MQGEASNPADAVKRLDDNYSNAVCTGFVFKRLLHVDFHVGWVGRHELWWQEHSVCRYGDTPECLRTRATTGNFHVRVVLQAASLAECVSLEIRDILSQELRAVVLGCAPSRCLVDLCRTEPVRMACEFYVQAWAKETTEHKRQTFLTCPLVYALILSWYFARKYELIDVPNYLLNLDRASCLKKDKRRNGTNSASGHNERAECRVKGTL